MFYFYCVLLPYCYKPLGTDGKFGTTQNKMIGMGLYWLGLKGMETQQYQKDNRTPAQ